MGESTSIRRLLSATTSLFIMLDVIDMGGGELHPYLHERLFVLDPYVA